MSPKPVHLAMKTVKKKKKTKHQNKPTAEECLPNLEMHYHTDFH